MTIRIRFSLKYDGDLTTSELDFVKERTNQALDNLIGVPGHPEDVSYEVIDECQ
jgi:hypothetical protein